MTEREKFEEWFKSNMYIADKCFVDQQTKRRLWSAWQAALASQQPADDGWIEWRGGLVPPVTGMVEVRYRNGQEQSGCKAGDYSWARGLGGLTIIAYRVVKP